MYLDIKTLNDSVDIGTECTSALKKVLLVEDNLVVLKLLELFLVKIGLYCTPVTTGEEALQYAKETSFDLIITDLGLPGISGYEFAESLRQWEMFHQKKSIPIVGITAQIHHETERLGQESGMWQVFSKPITLGTLQNIVAQLLIM